MIRCVCQHCHSPLEVGEPYAGAKIACKKCRAIVRIPAANAPPDSPAEVVTPPAAAPAAAAPPLEAAPRLAVKPAAPAPAPAKAAPKPPAAPAPSPAAKAAPGKPPIKPTPGSAPGTVPKPPVAPAPQAKAPPPKATPGSGPGTTPKPPAAAPRPAAPAPAPEIQVEMLTPTIVTVEAVRFGCAMCGGEVHAFMYQIGGGVECPACKGLTPVPAPLEGPGVDVAGAPIKAALKTAPGIAPKPGSGPGTAQKPPVAPAKGASPRPAPSAGPKQAPPTAQGLVPKPSAPAKNPAPRPAAHSFRFPCPHCKVPINADLRNAGLMMLCPHCKQNLPVPDATPA